MRRVPTVLPACRAGRTMSVLRRAHRFGRPTAGDGLILTTPCTSSATPSRSSLLTQPETGRGDASLWTAAAAPDHRLWTTLRGPLDPSRLPTSPHPRRRLRVASEQSIQPIKGGRPIVLRLPNPESAEITSQAQTGGPFPSIKVGHTGLSKPRGRTEYRFRRGVYHAATAREQGPGSDRAPGYTRETHASVVG